MSDDPYLADLRLSDAGDLVVGSHGGLIGTEGPATVVQALALRTRTFPGELPLHPDYGSQLAARLVGAKPNAVFARAIVNVELRQIITSDVRFLAARNIEVLADGDRLRVALDLLMAGGATVAIDDVGEIRIDELAAAVVEAAALGADDDLEDAFLNDDESDLDELPEIEPPTDPDPDFTLS